MPPSLLKIKVLHSDAIEEHDCFHKEHLLPCYDLKNRMLKVLQMIKVLQMLKVLQTKGSSD